MSPFDLTTVLSAGKVLTDLKAMIKKLGGQKPDVVSALTLVSKLQGQIDGLRSKVVELQTNNLELKRKNDEDEVWRTRTADIELFTTPGGATVYARYGKPPYFCTVCYEKRQLIPLQPRDSAADCHGCKSIFRHIQVVEPTVSVMQRRLPRGTVHF